jgi:hypothetical protein
VFSGAASRIAQEFVLMKHLVQGRAFGSRARDPMVPSVVAGSSPGALSAVALNAILQAEGLLRGRKMNDNPMPVLTFTIILRKKIPQQAVGATSCASVLW